MRFEIFHVSELIRQFAYLETTEKYFLKHEFFTHKVFHTYHMFFQFIAYAFFNDNEAFICIFSRRSFRDLE